MPCLQHVKDVRVIPSIIRDRCARYLSMVPMHVISKYSIDETGSSWIERAQKSYERELELQANRF